MRAACRGPRRRTRCARCAEKSGQQRTFTERCTEPSTARGGVGGLPPPGDAGIPGAPRGQSRRLRLRPRGALGAAVRGLAGADCAERGPAAPQSQFAVASASRALRASNRSRFFRRPASSREKPRRCWCRRPGCDRSLRERTRLLVAGELGRDGEVEKCAPESAAIRGSGSFGAGLWGSASTG